MAIHDTYIGDEDEESAGDSSVFHWPERAGPGAGGLFSFNTGHKRPGDADDVVSGCRV